jgi:hypothetical protein
MALLDRRTLRQESNRRIELPYRLRQRCSNRLNEGLTGVPANIFHKRHGRFCQPSGRRMSPLFGFRYKMGVNQGSIRP